jgi:hypothetical protein
LLHLSQYFFSAPFLGLFQPQTKQTSSRSIQGSLGSSILVRHNLINLPGEGRMGESQFDFFNTYLLLFTSSLLHEKCERRVYLTCQNRFLVPSQHQFILRKIDARGEFRDFTNTHRW